MIPAGGRTLVSFGCIASYDHLSSIDFGIQSPSEKRSLFGNIFLEEAVPHARRWRGRFNCVHHVITVPLGQHCSLCFTFHVLLSGGFVR